MNPWLNQLRGRFLVFDGPDGSGKSTQFRRFSEAATRQGIPVCEVREPGGTMVGEAIRKVLLEYQDDAHGEMDLRCEMLLFMASRAQLVAERIRPALQAGQLVLADRFISSTLAYQGAAGGIPISDILRVGQVALGQTWPDLVVVFDVDERTAAMRLNPLLDRMESKGAAYHAKVRQGYLDQAKNDPQHYLVVPSHMDADTVFADLMAKLAARFA
ncbi:MAG: dTMP kinase [Phycisphaeraceae bacterium]|nr:dTMP kinase [Phycisphaeraceae bacterium]